MCRLPAPRESRAPERHGAVKEPGVCPCQGPVCVSARQRRRAFTEGKTNRLINEEQPALGESLLRVRSYRDLSNDSHRYCWRDWSVCVYISLTVKSRFFRYPTCLVISTYWSFLGFGVVGSNLSLVPNLSKCEQE